MIAALSGKVIIIDGSTIVIDVQGVGYQVTVTTTVLQKAIEGESLSVVVVTEVRENDISLYGFSNRQEREVFLLLKKVKGVGAKLSLSIISSLGAVGLLTAIGRQEVALLTKVPGVGKKTAERLIVELREQVGFLATEQPSILSSKISVEKSATGLEVGSQPVYDAILALEKLGFERIRAEKAVEKVVTGGSKSESDAGGLVREALAYL